MIGGGAYAMGKRSQQASYREQDEEQRLDALEANQQAQAAPAPAAPAAAPAADTDLVGRLKQLPELKDSGALSQQEFDAAKAKLLAS